MPMENTDGIHAEKLLSQLNRVAAALREAGLEPYAQLTGYVTTGDPRYITRRSGARELVQAMDPGEIRRFLTHFRENQRKGNLPYGQKIRQGE